MDYGEILRRALAISWRHRYLWLLALLAGEGIGIGLPSFQQQPRHRGADERPSAFTLDQLTAWAAAHASLLIGIGIALAVLLIILVLISAVANGAVIRAAAEHDVDQPFGWRPAWCSGVTTFWPVLAVKLLNLLVILAVFALVGSLGLVTFWVATHGNVALAVISGVGAGVLFLAAIPFTIVFSVLIRLALRAVVLDGNAPLKAIGRGIGLIRRRFGRLALVWLLVLLSVGAVLAIFWVLVALVLSGAVAAFVSVVWTLAYRRLDLEPQPSAARMPAPA
jgi:hypothetical protein